MRSPFMRRAAFAVMLSSVACFGSSVVLAQRPRPQQRQPPQEKKEWDDTGTVEGVAGTTLQMMSSKSEPWAIQVAPGQSKVVVEGTAEPSFLRTGVNIRFNGELDAKGALQKEIAELEIYSPQGKNDAGLFVQGADEQAKPVPKVVAGAYTIKGRIASLKDNQITVVAGSKKVSGTLAESPSIKVTSSDLGYAQKGDTVKVKAWYTDSMKPDPMKNKPGAGWAQEIKVTMSEPLVGKKKAKPAKAKKAEPDNSTDNDPFGINKK